MGHQFQDYGTGNAKRCVDADQRNASTLHPSEVRQWDCYDETTSGIDYSPSEFALEDYVTVTCGCSTPQPAIASPPSPDPEPTSTCSDGDSFLVDTVVTQDGASLAGCFEDSGSTDLGVPVYYAGTIDEPTGESPVVYAKYLFPQFVSEPLNMVIAMSIRCCLRCPCSASTISRSGTCVFCVISLLEEELIRDAGSDRQHWDDDAGHVSLL